MRDWLVQYDYSDKSKSFSSNQVPETTPIDGLSATKINEQFSKGLSGELSVIEQYVVGHSYFIGKGLSFLNDGTNDVVTDALERLMEMTKRGKVWLRESLPVSLSINEMTEVALRQFEHELNFGSVSPIIKMLYLEQEHRVDKFEQMNFYRIYKESVSPKEIHPDLQLICEFLRGASWPDRVLSLQVSGWHFADLDKSNELICMLLSRYNELELIVSPSTGRVQCIRSSDKYLHKHDAGS
ncbi:MAG: hypothetical protein ACXVPC_02635 [Tumebacillaceae bacterium]